MTAKNIVTFAFVLNGYTAEVYDFVFAQSSSILASNSLDGTTRVWNLNFNELLNSACKKQGEI